MTLFFSAVLIFATILAAIPQEIYAASEIYLYECDDEVLVYEGAKEFYVGDLIEFRDDSLGLSEYKKYGFLTEKSGVTYKSSKPSVVKVDKKTGKIITKKRGKATITIKYKDAATKVKLKVVTMKEIEKRHSPGTKKSVLEEGAQKFLKKTGGMPKTINNANRYKLLSAYQSYDASGLDGMRMTLDDVRNDRCALYSTEQLRAHVICNRIEKYSDSLNPFSMYSEETFKVQSISGDGKSNKIVIKLKEKVTADQIYGAKYEYYWDSKLKESDTFTFPMKVQNRKTMHTYYAEATMKKGSNKITIKINNHKLLKNIEYKLLKYSYETWLDDSVNKNTFKVK